MLLLRGTPLGRDRRLPEASGGSLVLFPSSRPEGITGRVAGEFQTILEWTESGQGGYSGVQFPVAVIDADLGESLGVTKGLEHPGAGPKTSLETSTVPLLPSMNRTARRCPGSGDTSVTVHGERAPTAGAESSLPESGSVRGFRRAPGSVQAPRSDCHADRRPNVPACANTLTVLLSSRASFCA